ncbi:MAG: MMPL family transporter [Candidatus Latescibacteria bacterium]|nr:MMPL family transporter [Candidatus Latescibacterota bacterium]
MAHSSDDPFAHSLNRYASFLCHHPVTVTLLALGLTVLSFFLTKRLTIKSDFAELLPDGYRSVQDIHRITERVGGLGNLVVAIQSDDLKASERFADDLVVRLKTLPPGYVRYIEYQIDEEKKFYEDNQFMYANLEDLEEVRDRLRSRIQRKKLEQNPLFVSAAELGVEDDEGDKPFDISDIEEKYKNKAQSKVSKWKDGYFVGENGQLLAVIIKPYGTTTGVKFSEDLCNRVQRVIDGLRPASYHPSMRVGLTGKYRIVLDEYASIREEIVSTALFTVLLVYLAIYFYYWTFAAIIHLSIVVGMGILWTFAATYLRIGYLNNQTAFLGSLIVGNGINYGLIYMARYKEERLQNHDVSTAVANAMRNTIVATATASFATGVAYATLMITDFKGFNQFGFIGGLGMIFCWVATFTVLPALLVLWERTPFGRRSWTRRQKKNILFRAVAQVVIRAPRQIVVISTVLVVAAIGLIIWWLPNAFEYDFSKLRQESKTRSETRDLNSRVNRMFGISQNPAVILADRLDQVVPIRDAILAKKADEEQHPNPTIDECKTIFDLLPKDQDEKLEVLADIKRTLDENPPDSLGISPDQVAKVNDFKQKIRLKSLTIQDLPGGLARNFEESGGRRGLLIYVYPRPDAGLWNGKNLVQFAEVIRSNALPSGEIIYSSGEAVIFADMLKAVAKDGPVATVGAFVGVIGLLLISFRNLRASMITLASLMGGMILMGGVMVIFDIKVNFFNFIVIPTTLGIGVDYSVNMYQRYRLEGFGSVARIIQNTGGAVALCSLTTLIGYSSLLLASNRALVSFGVMANIGEVTTLLTALLTLPAYLLILEQRAGRAALAVPEVAPAEPKPEPESAVAGGSGK